MKPIFLLSCLVIAQARVTKRNTPCDGPIINNVHYSKEILKTDIDRPYLLSTDKATNTLYFSYTNDEEKSIFTTAKINLDNKDFADIDGPNNGFAQSVNAETHDVYIGGSDGIYKYTKANNKAEFYIAGGVDIWLLYYKKALYFSEYPSQFLYTVDDGKVVRFKDLEDTKVDNFVIDDDDYLFYTNDTGLYSQKKGTKDSFYYEGSDVSIRGLTTDSKGDVFVCVQDGIYALNKEKHTIERILKVGDAFGVAFDGQDNLVYSDATSLVRLLKSEDQTCDKTAHVDRKE